MAKKKNLPNTKSGKYRLQVTYIGDDGKRHLKSITRDTAIEAAAAAELWKKAHNNPEKKPRITVAGAVDSYINMKRAVLSPATMRSYCFMFKAHIEEEPIGRIYVNELTNTDLQIWISSLSTTKSAKTVKNIYTLLLSSVQMFDPGLQFNVTLPSRVKKERHCPNDADVKAVLDAIREKYGPESDLELAVLLAAFGTLRRGEICALEKKDLIGSTIHISKAMVENEDDHWDVKAPKTYESDRIVELPDFVIEMLERRGEGRVVSCSPDAISRRFAAIVKKVDVQYFRFHDLRHYSASIMHALGVPDQYIMARGGWASDNVMKTVYRNVIDIEQVKQTRKLNSYFSVNFG